MGAQGPRDGLKGPMSICQAVPHQGLAHFLSPTQQAVLKHGTPMPNPQGCPCPGLQSPRDLGHHGRTSLCLSSPAPAPAAGSLSPLSSGPVPCSLCLDTCKSRGGVPRPLPVTPLPATPLPLAPSCPSPPSAPSLNKDVAWHPAPAQCLAHSRRQEALVQ